MARRVFLSVIGTNNYKSSKYYVEGRQPVETRFVQAASITFHCSDFDDNDKVFIFCTDEAKQKNWEDNYEFPVPCSDKKEQHKGLKSCLQDLSLKTRINEETAVWIPKENSEDQIWETFDIVFKKLNDEDEIVFDITHGFRASPMLLMVLINYAKFLKNIKVRKILYGAFEARNEKNETKIWDLTNFSMLQDWTNSTNEFINFGHSDNLSKISIEESNNDIYSNNEKATLKGLADNIQKTSKLFSTIRGQKLLQGDDFLQLQNSLKKIKSKNTPKPLEPIF